MISAANAAAPASARANSAREAVVNSWSPMRTTGLEVLDMRKVMGSEGSRGFGEVDIFRTGGR